MQTPLKIALIAIVLLYIFFILKAVKRKNMRIGYLIFWTITGILLIILGNLLYLVYIFFCKEV